MCTTVVCTTTSICFKLSAQFSLACAPRGLPESDMTINLASQGIIIIIIIIVIIIIIIVIIIVVVVINIFNLTQYLNP